MLSLKKIYALSMLIAGSMLATAPAGYVEQKLTVNDGTGASLGFGHAVAVTADGKTIVAGLPWDNTNTGAIAIFKFQQDGFHQSGPKIVAQNTIGSEPCFGYSVDISADGKRIAVGTPFDNNNMGAVFIFDYNDQKAVWEQTTKIVSSNVIGTAVWQGYKVKLDADGSTLAFSGINDNNSVGAVWVYIYNGATWIEQAKLVGSNPIGKAEQGSDLGISADGNTIAFGAHYDNQDHGTAYVFGRNNSIWTQMGSKLQCSDITDSAYLGTGITLSSDSTTLLVGAPNNNNGYGAVCGFMKLGSQYVQQGNSFKGKDSTTSQEEGQGYSLALSSNKQTVLVGAPGDYAGIGAFYLFKHVDGSAFQQQGNKIKVDGVLPKSISSVGSTTAISKNTETLVVGAPDDDLDKGGVWAFYKSQDVPESTKFFDTTAGQVITWFGLTIGAGLVWYIFEKFVLKKMCHLKCPTCCKSSSGIHEVLLSEPQFSISSMSIDERV